MNKNMILGILFCALIVSGCSDDKTDYAGYDASKPIVVKDFSPKSGPSRTELYIRGSNFGTDLSKISLTIGGVETKVIGSTGDELYCMVPPKAHTGEITLNFTGDGGNTLSYTFPDKFEYQSQLSVGTIIRQVDEKGNSKGDIMGPWDAASVTSFEFSLYQHTPGDHRYIYMGANATGIRRLNLDEQTLEFILPATHTWRFSFAFSADGDTLFLPDVNRSVNNDQPNVYYSLKSTNFRKLLPYNYGPSTISVCYHPIDHTFFYLGQKEGTLYKKGAGEYDPTTGKNKDKALFNLNAWKGGDLTVNLFVHPTGKYMYMMGTSMPCLLRSEYNFETKEFEPPILFCGNPNATGYKESTGTDARFGGYNKVGEFVKNPQYEMQGKDDIYDFYFVDPTQHCVRRVTPEGSTSLFAGRSNSTQDGKISGYVDGEPTKEARFSNPGTVSYDPVDEIFYIGDDGNRAIRTISIE